MRGGEDLLGRCFLFGPQRSKKPNDAVRLKTVLDLVDQENRGTRRDFSLEPGDKQPRRAESQASEWNPAFIVQGDRPACDRDRMSI